MERNDRALKDIRYGTYQGRKKVDFSKTQIVVVRLHVRLMLFRLVVGDLAKK